MNDSLEKPTELITVYKFDPHTKNYAGQTSSPSLSCMHLDDNYTMAKPPKYDEDFEEIKYNEKTDMWEIVSVSTPLEQFKYNMEGVVNNAITRIIRKNITIPVQNSGIYQLKYDEATRYINKNSPVSLTNYPFLKAESTAHNKTAEECANIIIEKYKEWTKKLNEIEEIRQAAKAQIRAVEINSSAKTKIEKISQDAVEKLYKL